MRSPRAGRNTWKPFRTELRISGMSLTGWIQAYAAALAVFLLLDLLWLGWIARSYYRDRIGHLFAPRFRKLPALAFYGAYILGILYFAVAPGVPLHEAAVDGAIFGFFCYATYEMTNWATLRDWPVSIVVADIAWGTCLTALAAAAGSLAAG